MCGIKWSKDGHHLVSGGNDNKVNIYSANNLSVPEQSLSYHSAAVKAIQFWEKKRGVIVTGGGNNDHTLQFHNILTDTYLGNIKTPSQICAFEFSPDSECFLTAHSHQNNNICFYRKSNILCSSFKTSEGPTYPQIDFQQELTLEGHERRVLGLALGPTKDSVVSAGADETIKIWQCFPKQELSLTISPNAIFADLN